MRWAWLPIVGVPLAAILLAIALTRLTGKDCPPPFKIANLMMVGCVEQGSGNR
jgi:hypothetical protein